MGEKLKSLRELVDEREEVYFLIAFLVLTALVSVPLVGGDAVLTGTEYVAGVTFLYGALVAGNTVRRKEKSDE